MNDDTVNTPMLRRITKFLAFWLELFFSSWLVMLLIAPTFHLYIGYWRVFAASYLIYLVGDLFLLGTTIRNYKFKDIE